MKTAKKSQTTQNQPKTRESKESKNPKTPKSSRKNLPKMKILLGFSGSVATIKAPQLILSLQNAGHEVRAICTQNSLHFLKNENTKIEILTDSDEWSTYKTRGDPVLHIELAKWADLFLIAPLSANTMAKISNGICDNLLTCVARAWRFEEKNRFEIESENGNFGRKMNLSSKINSKMDLKLDFGKISFVVAPAMNSFMYTHSLTELQITVLKSFSIFVLPVVEKTLICGDRGIGAMAEVDDIVLFVNSLRLS